MYHPTTFFNGSPSAFLATPRENPLCVFARGTLRENLLYSGCTGKGLAQLTQATFALQKEPQSAMRRFLDDRMDGRLVGRG